jgi:hypothetical protein
LVNAVGVRKLGSCLVILLFLTAYGRCVADQLGMLHASDSACCRTVCEDVTCPDSLGPDIRPCETEPSGNHGQEEVPTPCQLCFILDSDSMQVEGSIKIPAPVFSELNSPPGLFSSGDAIVRPLRRCIREDLQLLDDCDVDTGQRCLPLRLRMKICPVRGPSVV